MKSMHRALFLSVGFLFVGCDQVGKHAAALARAKPMTIVIGPGYQVAIASKPVFVYGFDVCPEQDRLMTTLFGPDPSEGSANCIVVAPKTETVKVRLALASGVVVEEWTVRRGASDQLYLIRPNGEPVASYEAYSKP